MTTSSNMHRSASPIRHRRALSATAVAGLVGTLLALTLGSASAMPGRGDAPSASLAAVHTHAAHYVAHGCFITPHTLSDAVTESLPVCFTLVP